MKPEQYYNYEGVHIKKTLNVLIIPVSQQYIIRVYTCEARQGTNKASQGKAQTRHRKARQGKARHKQGNVRQGKTRHKQGMARQGANKARIGKQGKV